MMICYTTCQFTFYWLYTVIESVKCYLSDITLFFTVASRLAQRGKQVFKINDKIYDITISLHHEEADVDKVTAVSTFIQIHTYSVIFSFPSLFSQYCWSWTELMKDIFKENVSILSFSFLLLLLLRSCCVCRCWWTTRSSRKEKRPFCLYMKVFQESVWLLMTRKTSILWQGATVRFSHSAAWCWDRWRNRYHRS